MSFETDTTVFGVDWGTVDEKYNWLAVDRDGAVYAYTHEPAGTTDVCWQYYDNPYKKISMLGVDWFSSDWKTMIAERPKQQTTKQDVNTQGVSKGHKHHKEMLQYAQDAAVHKEPWKLWEWRDSYYDWGNLTTNPIWRTDMEYRRKPQTVTITIPEDVAIDFTNLIIVSDAGNAVRVAIQEALNKRCD